MSTHFDGGSDRGNAAADGTDPNAQGPAVRTGQTDAAAGRRPPRAGTIIWGVFFLVVGCGALLTAFPNAPELRIEPGALALAAIAFAGFALVTSGIAAAVRGRRRE